MPAQNVDFVLVVDASKSMGPCFDQVRRHLEDLLYPLQQANFKVRFGLLAYAVSKDGRFFVYDHTFVGGSGQELVAGLYSSQVKAEDYFTGDPAVVGRILNGLQPHGNEDTLLAVDIAADFPFGPVENTRRVIAVFSDETLEAGIAEKIPLAKLPELVDKLQQRRIQLFVSSPPSPGLEMLGAANQAQIEPVDGGDGLKSVDFRKLLAQMGKSISGTSLQMGGETTWKKAIYGQDQWTTNRRPAEAMTPASS